LTAVAKYPFWWWGYNGQPGLAPGKGRLNLTEMVVSMLIFAGVYFVNTKNNRNKGRTPVAA
jgi:hypothetical protein